MNAAPDRIKVVLVDDHEIFRDGIELIIDTLVNFEVVASFEDPYQLLDQIKSFSGSIFLVDIGMPSISGIELTRKIRKTDNHAKVILLTSNTDIQHVKLGLSVGVQGYLTKRVDKEELKTALAEVAAGRRYFSKDLSHDLLDELAAYVVKDRAVNELTERELDVLRELANGHSYAEIGNLLNVSVKTVETHRSNILKKTELKTTVDLVKLAIKLKLVQIN